MSINYEYTIIDANENARCMEIVYSAEGHETQHVGARLPYEGETVEQIVRMYAPVAYWLEKQRTVVVPEIGTTGVINAADEEAQATQAALEQAIVVGAEQL